MIDPSVSGVLRSKYTIRRFFFAFGGAFLLVVISTCVLAGDFPNGAIGQILASIMSNLAGSLAVIMLIYAVWIWLTPLELRNATIEPLRAGEIRDTIDDLTDGARAYWFLGRSGNFFRAVVLPRLNQESQRARSEVVVKIAIPAAWRARNATIYKTLITSLGETADDSTLPSSVLATILLAIDLTSSNSLLNIQIGLTPTLPSVRFDVSDRGAILTRDEKKLPAIYCKAGTPYFDLFRSIIDNEFSQSDRINWQVGLKLDDIRNAEDIEGKIIGLPQIDQHTLNNALSLIKSPVHRYGK